MQKESFLGFGFLALAFILSSLIIGKSLLLFKDADRSVEVKGLAERVVDSDEASWQLTFTVAADNLKELNEKSVFAQTSIHSFLQELNFAGEEIQKSPVQISDRQTDAYSNVKGLRFSARGSVTVVTKRVDEVVKASQKTDSLVQKGVILSSSNQQFYFTALNSIKPAMLEEATKNALEAAESFARTAGARVGKIRSASQGSFSIASPSSEYDVGGSLKKRIRVVSSLTFQLE